jgi:hypothetical protein
MSSSPMYRATPRAVALNSGSVIRRSGLLVRPRLDQEPRNFHGVRRRVPLASDLGSVGRHVMEQRLVMREWGAHPHQLRLLVEQPPKRLEVPVRNGVRGGLESGVDRVVPAGERICPVRIPVILDHRQPRRFEIDSCVLGHRFNNRGLQSCETHDLDSAALSSGDSTGQHLSLEGDPLANSNVRPIHRWR